MILFFESRDESQLEGAREVPGEVYRGEPVLSPGLEDAVAKGNVVVLHRDRAAAARDRGARRRERDRGCSELGLAVLFEPEPTLTSPLAAIADGRIEFGDTPAEIRNFVDFHLGP